MQMKILPLVAAVAALCASAANAAVHLVITGSPVANQDDYLGAPYTVNGNYNPGGYIFLQSWAFGTNAISVGGWLNFFAPATGTVWFNQASSLPTPYGNYFVTTSSPYYTLTGPLTPGAPSGIVFIDGTYALDDGGTLTVTTVPEPAGWAVMTLGFGLMGMAMRRRKVFVAA